MSTIAVNWVTLSQKSSLTEIVKWINQSSTVAFVAKTPNSTGGTVFGSAVTTVKAANDDEIVSTRETAPEEGDLIFSWTVKSQEVPIEALIVTLMIVFGVTGNLLTLVATARSKQLRKPLHILLTTVMVIDFVTCLVYLPPLLYGTIVNEWLLPYGLCHALGLTVTYVVSAPIVVNVALALNGYLGCFPSSPICTKLASHKATIIILAWIFIYHLAINFPVFLNLFEVEFNLPLAGCGIAIDVPPDIFIPYFIAFGVLNVYLPLLVVALLYVAITVRLTTQKVNFAAGKKIIFVKTIKVMASLFILEFVCWLPHVLQGSFIDPFFQAPVWVSRTNVILAFMNSVLDPYLLMWRIRDYRRAVSRLFRCCNRAVLPNVNNSTATDTDNNTVSNSGTCTACASKVTGTTVCVAPVSTIGVPSPGSS